MFPQDSLHIAIVAHIGWGHVRPMCALAARMVKLRDVDITFLTARRTHDKAVEEISRNFEGGEEALQKRIRVVGLVNNEQDMSDQKIIGKSFEEQLQNVLAARAVFCASKRGEFPALKPPHAFVIDIFCYDLFEIIRRHSSTAKVLVSLPASILSIYALSGPFDHDSHGEMNRRVQDYMKETGKPLVEAAQAVLNTPSDRIIQGPGLPSIYQYENYPQELFLNMPILGYLHLSAANLMHECDGFIACSMRCVEPKETIQALSAFVASTYRKMFFLGPLLPLTKRAKEEEHTQVAKSSEIAEFVQNTLHTHGERSMIYISFGTVFWPSKPDKIWAFLDVLMEKKVPFIMAQASPFCHLPEDVADKVKASGTGLITTWAPQQAILEHPVTGWFVTHGGFNSITESVHAGVPMICWPYAGDQPLNTIHLTENLKVAYELLEVRSGEGLKPICRTGKAPTGTLDAVRMEASLVLEKAFSEDGERKRANIQRLREEALRLWDEDGEARGSAKQLLDSLST